MFRRCFVKMTDILKVQSDDKLKVCRICATKCENGQKLFDNNSETQKIAVHICSLLSVKLDERIQIYPNWICSACRSQFEVTYQFFAVIINGQRKLVDQFGYCRKPGRKPKPKINFFETINDDHFNCPVTDNLKVGAKRVSKIPERFKDSMQGNELEDVYCKFGVARRRRRQSKIEKSQTVALIEDENGMTLGEMISIRKESQRNSTRYQCEFCKEIFVKELAFYNHLANHTNILYECLECRAVFRAKSMFDEHVQESNHTGLGIIETPFPETATNTNNQDEGTAELATEEKKPNILKKFQCLKCPKSFDTNAAMQRHERTHSNRRPFQCDICLAKFKRKYVLKVHKTTHTRKCPFKCHLCSKRFSHNRSLKIHINGIHRALRPYSCLICRKSFSQKSNLQIHMRIHTGDRPFVCLRCGAAFKTSSQCHTHQKTHAIQQDLENARNEASLTKPHLCNICGRLFSLKSNLQKHIRVHTGEKPYACIICSRKFSDSSNLKKHQQNHAKLKKKRPNRISLLKSNFSEGFPSNIETDPNLNLFGLIPLASNSFMEVENVLSNVNNSLMNIMDGDDAENDKNTNQWDPDVFMTDIPNDENSIVQQQQQEELLTDQLVCISYEDPTNSVGVKKTFYVVN